MGIVEGSFQHYKTQGYNLQPSNRPNTINTSAAYRGTAINAKPRPETLTAGGLSCTYSGTNIYKIYIYISRGAVARVVPSCCEHKPGKLPCVQQP